MVSSKPLLRIIKVWLVTAKIKNYIVLNYIAYNFLTIINQFLCQKKIWYNTIKKGTSREEVPRCETVVYFQILNCENNLQENKL